MRKFLRSLRSSPSLLRPRPSSREEEEPDEVRLSTNNGDVSQVEDSNHEEEEEEEKEKKSDNVNERCSPRERPPSNNDLGDMSLEDLTRITKRDTKKERRHKYRQAFVRNHVIMTVTQTDILPEPKMEDGLENGDDCSYFDSDMYQGSLTIPRDNHPTVPNYCVICLEEYQPADRVVWSHQCEHAFHRDCIVKYFDKIQRKVPDTPCPCCRATYTDLTVELRAKKRVGRARRGRTTAGAIIAGIPWFR